MIWKLVLIFTTIGITNSYPFNKKDYLTILSLGQFIENLNTIDMNMYKETCLKTTGNNDSYAEVEQASNQFDVCTDVVFPKVGSSLEFLDFVKLFCENKSIYLDCLKKFNEVYKKCLDRKHKKLLVDSEQSDKKILEYICYNNAERVKSFMDDSCGNQCASKLIKDTLNCGSNLLTDLNAIITPKLVLTEKGDVAECKAYKNFGSCLVGRLKTYRSENKTKIFEDFIDYSTNQSGC